ncbi:MAG TPA: redoxin domain-containing protein [Blastocatellia bacterium]|nr:redoxin domain-containing protein [Blastocatellia bacterium]
MKIQCEDKTLTMKGSVFMLRAGTALALILILLSPVYPTQAQDANPAQELLRKVGETYRNTKSYHFESTAVVESSSARMESKMNIPITVAAVRPENKVRFDVKSLTLDVVTVSDGKTKWSYLPAAREYMKEPVEPEDARQNEAEIHRMAGFLGVRIPSYEDIAERVKSAKILREEALEVQGKKIDCYVVEVEYEPDGRKPGVEVSPKTFWVDKARNVVLKEFFTTKVKPHPLRNIIETKQTITFAVAMVNEPLPDALFTFAAPENAAEVEALDLPGREPRGLAGRMAKDFTLNGLDGKPVALKDLRGKVVLLDFWASWCAPCRIEMPHLEKLHREYKDKGLVVLGVNDEDAATARAFLKSKGYTFPTLVDDKREVSELYEVESIPTVFVINREGKIVVHYIGARSEKELRDALKKAGMN